MTEHLYVGETQAGEAKKGRLEGDVYKVVPHRRSHAVKYK
jgi:hypothetical protein